MNRGDIPYSGIIGLEIENNLDFKILGESYLELLIKYGILRSTISQKNKNYFLNISLNSELGSYLEEITSLGEFSTLSELIINLKYNQLRDHGVKLFYRIRNDKIVDVVYRFHHSIFDGLSGLIFLDLLFRKYDSICDDVDFQLPDLKYMKASELIHTKHATSLFSKIKLSTKAIFYVSKNLLFKPPMGVFNQGKYNDQHVRLYTEVLSPKIFDQISKAAILINVSLIDILITVIFRSYIECDKKNFHKRVKVLFIINLREKSDLTLVGNLFTSSFLTLYPDKFSSLEAEMLNVHRQIQDSVKAKYGIGSLYLLNKLNPSLNSIRKRANSNFRAANYQIASLGQFPNPGADSKSRKYKHVNLLSGECHLGPKPKLTSSFSIFVVNRRISLCMNYVENNLKTAEIANFMNIIQKNLDQFLSPR